MWCSHFHYFVCFTNKCSISWPLLVTSTISWIELIVRAHKIEGQKMGKKRTHYFVIEFKSIVMRSLQNWWLITILWTDFSCSHFFVSRIRRTQWGGLTKYSAQHENTIQQSESICHFGWWMWFRLGKNGKLIFLGLRNVRIVLYVYILSKILGQNHCKFFLVFFQS